MNDLITEVLEDIGFRKSLKRAIEDEILDRSYNKYSFRNTSLGEALKDKINKRFSELTKRKEFNDVIENSLNKLISEDTAEEIISAGIQAFIKSKRSRW